MPALLEVEGLECLRDDRVLFSNLSFRLDAGQALIVEGINGCGKTTLLRAVCGLFRPEAGVIRWRGEPVERRRQEFLSSLAWLGHHDGLKLELTALENLRVARSLSGDGTALEPVAALEQVGLRGYEEVPVRRMSAGQRRRTALARLLVSGARLWVLDEPFTALDREGVALGERLLDAHCAAGGMALLSSHHDLELASAGTEPIRLSP